MCALILQKNQQNAEQNQKLNILGEYNFLFLWLNSSHYALFVQHASTIII